MEKIYTIPINEAFEHSLRHPEWVCPLCTLYKTLQTRELDLILGASMMESDVRLQTNESGFCAAHYQQMFARKNRLSLALMLESHLQTVSDRVTPPKTSVKSSVASSLPYLQRLENSCYICGRIESVLEKMTATIVYLWESDSSFRQKFETQKGFCLPHYRRLLDYAKARLSKKTFAAFHESIGAIMRASLDKLVGDVSWFCKKFDYRYDDQPWYDAKDAVERAIRFLGSDAGGEDKP
ncbi:MAG: DUF6062 family protein [Eubacteriales bacterium]